MHLVLARCPIKNRLRKHKRVLWDNDVWLGSGDSTGSCKTVF